MILLDTNVISEMRKIGLGRANVNVQAWASSIDVSQTYLSSVVIGELYYGVLLKQYNRDLVQAEQLKHWIMTLIESYDGRILDVDTKVAATYAKLQVPNPKSPNDSYIGATAIAYNLTLATRNIKDFSGMPVKLINPFEYQA